MATWQHYYNAGIDYKQQGNWPKSAEAHVKALELAPELAFAEAWHNAGAALLRVREPERAQPYLHKALYYYNAALAAGQADPADRLFWKAAVYSLLGQKDELLATLRACFAEDDSYASEAQFEEDFEPYAHDPDFRALLDPILEKIKAATYRGNSLAKNEVTPAQATWRAAFEQELAGQGWVRDETVEELWQADMHVSPQGMYTCRANPTYGLRVSLHLDTLLLFVELHHRTIPDDVMQFRLYYTEAQLPAQLRQSLRLLVEQQATLTTDTMSQLLKSWLPTCASLQLQELDGTRHVLSAT